MLNYYDVEMLAFERQRNMELVGMPVKLLTRANLARRSPWRERLAVGLIGLAARIAPPPATAPSSEAKLAYLRQA